MRPRGFKSPKAQIRDAIRAHAEETGEKRKRAPSREIEQKEQTALMNWCAGQGAYKWPELRLAFSVKNEDKRTLQTGAKHKRAGMKKGVPDCWFPIPRHGLPGLVIELKTKEDRLSNVKQGKLTPEQRTWLEDLRKVGYCALCCDGTWEAVAAIEAYMEGRISQVIALNPHWINHP